MIIVNYLPVFLTSSPLPNGKQSCSFSSYEDFKTWVKSYVCIHCLEDFEEFYERKPTTVSDWLSMGCGCEIEIIDESNAINWKDFM